MNPFNQRGDCASVTSWRLNANHNEWCAVGHHQCNSQWHRKTKIPKLEAVMILTYILYIMTIWTWLSLKKNLCSTFQKVLFEFSAIIVKIQTNWRFRSVCIPRPNSFILLSHVDDFSPLHDRLWQFRSFNPDWVKN